MANKAYPKIYHEVYPYVIRVCEREDLDYNAEMYPFPKEKKIESMVDEIYDNYEQDYKMRSDEEDDEDYFRQPRRRRLFRDFVRILLIRELLGRRRRRRRPYGYDYGYDYDYPYYY